MGNSYKVNFKLPRPAWQPSILIIMKAYNGLPPGIEGWSITAWKSLVKSAEEILKQSFEKGLG